MLNGRELITHIQSEKSKEPTTLIDEFYQLVSKKNAVKKSTRLLGDDECIRLFICFWQLLMDLENATDYPAKEADKRKLSEALLLALLDPKFVAVLTRETVSNQQEKNIFLHDVFHVISSQESMKLPEKKSSHGDQVQVVYPHLVGATKFHLAPYLYFNQNTPIGVELFKYAYALPKESQVGLAKKGVSLLAGEMLRTSTWLRFRKKHISNKLTLNDITDILIANPHLTPQVFREATVTFMGFTFNKGRNYKKELLANRDAINKLFASDTLIEILKSAEFRTAIAFDKVETKKNILQQAPKEVIRVLIVNRQFIGNNCLQEIFRDEKLKEKVLRCIKKDQMEEFFKWSKENESIKAVLINHCGNRIAKIIFGSMMDASAVEFRDVFIKTSHFFYELLKKELGENFTPTLLAELIVRAEQYINHLQANAAAIIGALAENQSAIKRLNSDSVALKKALQGSPCFFDQYSKKNEVNFSPQELVAMSVSNHNFTKIFLRNEKLESSYIGEIKRQLDTIKLEKRHESWQDEKKSLAELSNLVSNVIEKWNDFKDYITLSDELLKWIVIHAPLPVNQKLLEQEDLKKRLQDFGEELDSLAQQSDTLFVAFSNEPEMLEHVSIASIIKNPQELQSFDQQQKAIEGDKIDLIFSKENLLEKLKTLSKEELKGFFSNPIFLKRFVRYLNELTQSEDKGLRLKNNEVVTVQDVAGFLFKYVGLDDGYFKCRENQWVFDYFSNEELAHYALFYSLMDHLNQFMSDEIKRKKIEDAVADNEDLKLCLALRSDKYYCDLPEYLVQKLDFSFLMKLVERNHSKDDNLIALVKSISGLKTTNGKNRLISSLQERAVIVANSEKREENLDGINEVVSLLEDGSLTSFLQFSGEDVSRLFLLKDKTINDSILKNEYLRKLLFKEIVEQAGKHGFSSDAEVIIFNALLANFSDDPLVQAILETIEDPGFILQYIAKDNVQTDDVVKLVERGDANINYALLFHPNLESYRRALFLADGKVLFSIANKYKDDPAFLSFVNQMMNVVDQPNNQEKETGKDQEKGKEKEDKKEEEEKLPSSPVATQKIKNSVIEKRQPSKIQPEDRANYLKFASLFNQLSVKETISVEKKDRENAEKKEIKKVEKKLRFFESTDSENSPVSEIRELEAFEQTTHSDDSGEIKKQLCKLPSKSAMKNTQN